MKTITLVSTAHIQSYLYEKTNRLTESFGASQIVEKAFDYWKGRDEEVFIGGGNAALLFDGPKEQNAIPAIRTWSSQRLAQAPGLRFIAAHVPFPEGELAKAYQTAKRKLEEHSGLPPFGSPAGAFPISRICPSTALAAEVWDSTRKQWVNRETRRKRATVASDPLIPRDFDELGTRQGEAHLAVVHADGNGIGQLFDELVDDSIACSDEKFCANIAGLSERVTRIASEAEKALRSDVDVMTRALGSEGLINPNEKFLPFRPLVGAGDDTTFITHGRMGISLAARYLQHFERCSEKIAGKKLTACAGVLIMPAKYPFARGYQIASALTNEAKKKRKAHSYEGSWIDFHLLLENATGTLAELRRHYQISPTENLLSRPYRLGSDWTDFESIFQSFRDSADEKDASFAPEGYWPRSASKLLLETLWEGESATRPLLQRFKTRNRFLPAPGNQPIETGWRDNGTPYFDPLEILDHHVRFDWENGEVFRGR